ncbi:hypothetical protein OVA19_00240 [Streptomyces sp. SL203]|nr:hypothetical protein [Streptomyces sp. SL203]MCY1649251.1 hypothetical protein [Streptomyces sp. SL203]
MGWLHQDDESAHEGFVIAVLPDGSDGPRDTFDELGETDGAFAWRLKYDGAHGHPKAAGIKADCYCGWRGPRRPADFNDPDAAEEVLRREWFHHVEVSLSQTLPRRIQRLMDDLEEAVLGMMAPPRTPAELDDTRPLIAAHAATLLRNQAARWQEEAVRAAKADYSWEEIAKPLMMTKQSAHERFR